ncbi:MAG: hypothetical protein GY898_07455 [Proteobacteria bacterium]|nr:hypothetical protein [Pseudomonadota bacterium]
MPPRSKPSALFLLCTVLAFAGCATSSGTPEIDGTSLNGWCSVESNDFSFFVTSMAGLWALSGDDVSDMDGGFGGNFGGIEGADEICAALGAATGHGDRDRRAFLSATDDGGGAQVHAIERIGEGPWYDANGRLVATGIDGLLADSRPDGDAQTVDDLPDECGVPISALGAAHDVITGSNSQGRLDSTSLATTCNDWTADSGAVGSVGGSGGNTGVVQCGHSFPREAGGPGPSGSARSG